MGDFSKKTVSIYIDQSAAENALESLQKKADGFNKKIDEARTKQTALLEKIKQSESAAANIDSLKKSYNDVGKEIGAITKKLGENGEETKVVKQQLQSLTDSYESAVTKQKELALQIKNSQNDGKSTTKLQQQYDAVGREIDRTSQKLHQQTLAFYELDQSTEGLKTDLTQLKVKQKGVNDEMKLAGNAARTIKNAEREYTSLDKAVEANTDSLTKNKGAQKLIQDQVDKGLRPSLDVTRNLVAKLRNELSKMSEDAPGYAQKFETFQKAGTELDRLEAKMSRVQKTQRSWFADAKTVAFGVLIGNTVQSAIASLTSYLSGILSGNAKLTDSLADIRRVSGLTAQEAEGLNKKLKAIDTRTAVAQLREIAIVAGKLGVAKEDIASFTKSVDQLVVALGDELGDANQITTTLGKILNVFDGKVTGENILQLGNAFVVLANAGVASGGFIADFTQRVSGIAHASNLSLGATVGLGAGLEELGGKVESSATAIQKLVTTIGADIPKAAKIAGAKTKKEIQEFANLFAKAPEEALLRFAEGLTKNKKAFSEISSSFKDAGEEGARTISTLIQLGQKADFFREKMDLGKKSISDTSAITDAFALKNENLGAEIDKLGKKFTSFVQSKTLSELFKSGVHAIIGFIDVLKAVPDFIANNRTAIALLVTGIVLMNGAYIAAALATTRDSIAKAYNAVTTRLTAAASTIATAAQAAYIVVTNLLAARITVATALQRLWNVALSLGAGPIGLIVVAAGALVYMLGNLIGATKTLNEEQKLQANLQSKIAEDIGDQKDRTQELLALAKNVNIEYGVRKQALDALIKQNPDYLQGLTLENINSQKGVDIIEDYISALDRLAKAKALRGIREDLAKQRLSQDIDLNVLEGEANSEGFASKAIGNVLGTGANAKYTKALGENVEASKKFNAATDAINKEVSQLNFQIGVQENKLKGLKKGTEDYATTTRNLNALLKERNIYLGLTNTTTPGTTTDVTVTSPDDKKTEKAAEKKRKKEDAERTKLLQDLKDFQFELSQIGKQADESEIARITRKYDDLIKQAIHFHVAFVELENEKNRAVAFLQQKAFEEGRKLADKKFLDDAKIEYEDSLVNLSEAIDNLKDIETKRYAEGVINKTQYEDNIKAIDRSSTDQQIGIAESYSNYVKKAAEDVNKFKKQKRKEDLQDAVADAELQRTLVNRDLLASSQIAVLKAPNSKARLDAQIRLLKEENRQAVDSEKLTATEKEKINEEYRQKEAQLTLDYYAGQVNQILGFMSQGLDIISKFNDAKSAKEKAALDKELKQNDTRKNGIKKLVDYKVISEQEGKRRLAAIEKQEEARKEALEKKQQARAKRIAVAQAIINGAVGVTKALENPFPLNLIQVAFAIATTAAQIATISAQKFADGGRARRMKNGKITDAPNIPVQDNGDNILATLKTGEVVLNEEQQRRLGGAATFRSIGVPGFANGGTIKPFWQARPYRSMNYGRVTESIRIVKFAEGGLVQKQSQDEKEHQTPQPVVIEKTDPEMKEIMKAVIYHLQNPASQKLL